MQEYYGVQQVNITEMEELRTGTGGEGLLWPQDYFMDVASKAHFTAAYSGSILMWYLYDKDELKSSQENFFKPGSKDFCARKEILDIQFRKVCYKLFNRAMEESNRIKNNRRRRQTDDLSGESEEDEQVIQEPPSPPEDKDEANPPPAIEETESSKPPGGDGGTSDDSSEDSKEEKQTARPSAFSMQSEIGPYFRMMALRPSKFKSVLIPTDGPLVPLLVSY